MAGDRQRSRVGSGLKRVAPLLPLMAFLGLVALVPVAALFGAAFLAAGPRGAAMVLGDPLNRLALTNSVGQGAASAAAALGVGFPAGVILGRYRWTGQGLVRSLLLVPFLLPSIVMVEGVESLFGPGGLLGGAAPPFQALGTGFDGIVLVNTLFNVPLVAVLTAAGAMSASEEVEATVATLGAGPWRSFRDAWGPGALAGAAAGGLLTFIFSALSFAPPILLCGPRCYTLEARVYALDQTLLDPTGAAILAAGMFALLAIPTVGYFLLLRRLGDAPPRRSAEDRRPPLRGPLPLAGLGLAAVPIFLVALLLGDLVVQGVRASVPGGGPGSAWSYLVSATVTQRLGASTATAATNSLTFAAAAASIAVVLGVFAGAARAAARGAGQVYRWTPLLVSPVLLSFGIAQFWEPGIGGPAEVGVLIILAQATVAIPFALSGLELALSRVPARFRDTAATLGAAPFTAYLEAELPLVRPSLVTAAVLAFALGLGEFTATNFLVVPSATTLPVELYWLLQHRATGPAESLASLLIVVSLTAFILIERGSQRVVV